MNAKLSPLQLAKSLKKVERKPSRSKVVATKPTTVFDATHEGYNTLDSLDHCPVCLMSNSKATLTTADGRKIPVSFCLRHRICLPLPSEG